MEQKFQNFEEKLKQHPAFKNFNFLPIINYINFEIPRENLIEISKLLRDEFKFDMLIDIVGVDRFTKKDRFELVYNIYSNEQKLRIFYRIKLDSKNPEADTITSIWKTADWQEREVFDMFGIKFNGHPDLRRIYLAEDFGYYPLRKDFPLMGIPGSISLPKK